MSNAARHQIPGTGDDGKVHVYDETADEWDLVELDLGTGRTVRTPEQDSAVGNGMVLHDASITSGDATLTSPSATFTGRSGQSVWVAGAGAAGALLSATISSVNSATSVELNTNASTTVSGVQALVGTNDTSALNTWLARAASDVELRATPGAVYIHSGLIEMDTKSDALLVGKGALFVAPVAATSAVQFFDVAGLEIRGLDAGMHPEPASRGTTGDHYGMYFEGCTDMTLHDLHAFDCHAAGILLLDCHDVHGYNSSADRTRADGLHFTGGTSRVRWYGHVSTGVEDDGVAVVSYTKADPGSLCSDIKVWGARSWFPKTAGRGVTIVGGHDCWYYDFEVYGTQQAGLYIACEGSFDTHRVTESGARGGRVVGCVRDAGYDHGAIFVYNGEATLDNDGVTIEGVEVVDSGSAPTASAAVRVGNDAGTGGDNLRVTLGSDDQPIYVHGSYWPPGTQYDSGQDPDVSNIVLSARTPPSWYIGWASYAGGTVNAGDTITATVTTGLTGVTVSGSVVTGVMLSGSNAGSNGMRYWGHPSANDTVRVYAENTSGGNITLGAGQWNVTATDI